MGAVRPSDCADIDVRNELDGFNIQPRISIPFSGPIDISTVSSSTVFLVGAAGRLIGINQVVWEPAAQQIAAFLAGDGAVTIDPDGPAPFFETPTTMVPEDLAFIP
jgi:hypothetical protein